MISFIVPCTCPWRYRWRHLINSFNHTFRSSIADLKKIYCVDKILSKARKTQKAIFKNTILNLFVCVLNRLLYFWTRSRRYNFKRQITSQTFVQWLGAAFNGRIIFYLTSKCYKIMTVSSNNSCTIYNVTNSNHLTLF